ncbi:MAG: hypothetical protein KKC26_05150 [Nanoarchaeota archaeon]|nr:hypothetical protein [Nanoarchaeota archaeon]MBU1850234.1 hypothetical protein [Nanoarchaeota archaeon]
MLSKKAQLWMTDFIIGFLILSLGITFFVKFAYDTMSEDKFLAVQKEAGMVSDFLLGEGVPSNWTNETLVRIGLYTKNQLNKTKVLNFYNLDYNDTWTYLSTNHDYFLFFQKNNSVINISRCGYGNPEVSYDNCTIDLSLLEYENLVKINRLVTFNKTIIELVLYLWD